MRLLAIILILLDHPVLAILALIVSFLWEWFGMELKKYEKTNYR